MSPHFEVVCWTAATLEYASPIINRLDLRGVLFDYVLTKEHCTEVCHRNGDLYVKDLLKLGRPIEDIIIIDNEPTSYLY